MQDLIVHRTVRFKTSVHCHDGRSHVLVPGQRRGCTTPTAASAGGYGITVASDAALLERRSPKTRHVCVRGTARRLRPLVRGRHGRAAYTRQKAAGRRQAGLRPGRLGAARPA